MGIIRKFGRGITRIAGILLILLGLFSGYCWFYRFTPFRHLHDPNWISSHCSHEYWEEMQSSMQRFAWTHDEAFSVGKYGDKYWVEWIMDRLEPDTELDCFGNHKGLALAYMTNQDAGDAKGWLAWWKKNKNKSQVEWIRDGFAQQGIAVEMPRMHKETDEEKQSLIDNSDIEIPDYDNLPTREQTEALLVLLVLPDSNILETSGSDAKLSAPSHLKYNAFRWLRDTEFDPVAFTLDNPSLSDKVQQGLREYSRRQCRYPAALQLGTLNLLVEDEPDGWRIASREFKYAAYAMVFMPLCIGIALIAWPRRGSRDGKSPDRHKVSTSIFWMALLLASTIAFLAMVFSSIGDVKNIAMFVYASLREMLGVGRSF